MPASILFNTSNTYERLLSRNSSAENNRQYCLIYMNDRNGEPADEGKIFLALRSSHRKLRLKVSRNLRENRGSFLIYPQLAILLKKRLWYRCFQ